MAESQQTYPYEELINRSSKGQLIELSFSQSRLSPYMYKAGYDYEKAFNLYLYNARLSKSFLFPLHALEITLRNKIHGVLTKEFSENWHCNNDFLKMVEEKGENTLKKAEKNAVTNSIEDIIANCTFEFWTYLLHNKNDVFWRTNFTKLTKSRIKRGELFSLIKKINDFRNRIAHYEPILDKPFFNIYNGMLDALQYLNHEVYSWVKEHSTVKMIMKTEPSSSGNPKPLLKDKVDLDFKIISSLCNLSELPNSRFLFVENRDIVLNYRAITQYLLSQVDEEGNLILEMCSNTIDDVIKSQNLKKNIVEFGETESFLHTQKMFKGKRVKYIIVKTSLNQIKGIIEKPHRQA